MTETQPPAVGGDANPNNDAANVEEVSNAEPVTMDESAEGPTADPEAMPAHPEEGGDD